MTTTLMTGIHGFTGRYLAESLLNAGHNVHGVVRAVDQADFDPRAMIHVCDLLDPKCLADIIAGVRPDYVIHLAGVAFVAHDDLDEMYRANILGARALLAACTPVSQTLRAVLVASSASVYGNAHEGTLTEDAPIKPANDYGVTKAAVEHLAAIYGARLPVIVARPFNYTGVGQTDSFLIPKIVSSFKRREPVIALGNLDVARDFSDVRTVVDAYLRLIQQPNAIGNTFNICSGEATSLRDVVALASEIAGYEIEVTINPAFVRTDEVKVLRGSRQKVERVIGPLKMIRLKETLRWMMDS